MVTKRANPLQQAIDDGLVTVADLINETGFSRSKVQGHTKGLRVPSRRDRVTYARILNRSIDVLDAEWFGKPRPAAPVRPRFPIKELAAVVRALEEYDRDELAVQIGVDVLIDMLGAAKEPPMTAVLYRDEETPHGSHQPE